MKRNVAISSVAISIITITIHYSTLMLCHLDLLFFILMVLIGGIQHFLALTPMREENANTYDYPTGTGI